MASDRRMATRIAEEIEPVVRGAVESAAASLEGISVSPAGARTIVRVTVDLPRDAIGAMTLDQVADASRAISNALDEADIIAGKYFLEVSTPGTDRPLTELYHYGRARTRLVRLTLADGGSGTGRVTEVSDDEVVLTQADGSRFVIAFPQVARGRIEVELNRIDDADFGDQSDQQGQQEAPNGH